MSERWHNLWEHMRADRTNKNIYLSIATHTHTHTHTVRQRNNNEKMIKLKWIQNTHHRKQYVHNSDLFILFWSSTTHANRNIYKNWDDTKCCVVVVYVAIFSRIKIAIIIHLCTHILCVSCESFLLLLLLWLRAMRICSFWVRIRVRDALSAMLLVCVFSVNCNTHAQKRTSTA